MPWFLIWTVLVVGAVVVLGLLGRSVYRSAKATGRELGQASDVLAEMSDRAAERSEAAEQAIVLAPVVLDDPEPARRRRALALQARERRRAARQRRREVVYARWRSFSH
ncbi:MAG TPA: hypothetical protein VGK35_07735 [Actinotalea sp.]